MKLQLKQNLEDSVKVMTMVKEDQSISNEVINISKQIIYALENDKKVLFFGNGGSAADSQHMSGEFISKFLLNRASLPGIALTTDTSTITSISNDFGYEYIFSRQIEGIGQKGDIAFAFSTSGNSSNVILGLKKAKEMNMKTVGFTGKEGGKMNQLCDYLIKAPSKDVPRIQEVHLLIGHIICQLIEQEFHSREK